VHATWHSRAVSVGFAKPLDRSGPRGFVVSACFAFVVARSYAQYMRDANAVLLVEDNADSGDALEMVLRAGGFQVSAAEDGQEALDQLRRGFEPAVILLDLMMPRKDGWEFRREQVRDPSLADIPVVILSGHSPLAASADQLGVAEFVRKPVETDELLGLASRYCTGH